MSATTIRRIGRERCYRYPVVIHDQNPAAHGDICYTEERDDGARREVNANGHHQEIGPWGPSREARRAHAIALRRAASAMPTPQPLEFAIATVRIDRDGYIISTPRENRGFSRAEEGAICASLPAAWIAAAKALRGAVVAAEDAEAQV